MTTLSRIGRTYPAPAWARGAGSGGASAPHVREAIRNYGYARGWHTSGLWGGFLTSMCGETASMRAKYPEMFFREGSIKSPLLSAVWSVASLDLQVLPADKKNARDREVADAYAYALLHAKGGMPQTATEILLPARVRGESLCHLSLRERLEDRGKYRGKRLINAVKAKPPGSYQLHFDGFGNLDQVKAAVGGATYTGDQLDEFVHYKWLSLEGSAGVSDLRAAVGAFEAKDTVAKLRMFFADKMAGGYMAVTGVTDQNRAAVRAALEEGRSCGFITLPPGMDVKMLDLVLGASAEFKSFIEDCDREMMIAVGSSHLPFQEGQTSNGAGDTSVQKTVSSQTEWRMAADLGIILTEKAKVFVDENYAGADYPEVRLGGGVDPSVTKSQLDVAEQVNRMVPVSAEYLYELSSVPPPKDDADRVGVPSAAGVGAAGGLPFADGGKAGGEWAWEEDLAGTEAGSGG